MPSGNFHFLADNFESFFEQAHKAENFLQEDAEACAIFCRKALEEMVIWMFDTDRNLDVIYDDDENTLNALMHKPGFVRLVGNTLFTDINAIRRTGNNAVHFSKKKISFKDAYTCIINLHAFSQWLVSYYGDKLQSEPFDIKKIGVKANEEITQLAEIKLKEVVTETPTGIEYHSPSEALTRELYIDLLLMEAGWDVNSIDTKSEYLLKHSASGTDRADYVLFGADGKALAVVEAKKTKVDGRDKGLKQASRYADALEKEFGSRPILFASNGFEHYIWDDLNYPPREVQGFYSEEDLETLINRRIIATPIADQAVDKTIAGRYYQIESI
ncbi:DUF4145 domain-containing protein [Pedobacter frigidisoli]|uniref:DUF4145 domain-containing protein n=1 Tax=Pedobacter frigidisoli TaxID=2530455 RepID=A0A4R0P4H1_9SPHI|nr:type I restriction endonuclease [Pedobacter frigidisoli]TCD10577.1 DUF4145 domain-containing protein [Pedobacter frigidisoli]